jgi:hypothetical protein
MEYNNVTSSLYNSSALVELSLNLWYLLCGSRLHQLNLPLILHLNKDIYTFLDLSTLHHLGCLLNKWKDLSWFIVCIDIPFNIFKFLIFLWRESHSSYWGRHIKHHMLITDISSIRIHHLRCKAHHRRIHRHLLTIHIITSHIKIHISHARHHWCHWLCLLWS